MRYDIGSRPARMVNIEEICLLSLLERYGEVLNSDVHKFMIHHGLGLDEKQLNAAIKRYRDAGLIKTISRDTVKVAHAITPFGRKRLQMVSNILERIRFLYLMPPEKIEESDYKTPECIADHGTQEP
jgi:hypothetical protein